MREDWGKTSSTALLIAGAIQFINLLSFSL